MAGSKPMVHMRSWYFRHSFVQVYHWYAYCQKMCKSQSAIGPRLICGCIRKREAYSGQRILNFFSFPWLLNITSDSYVIFVGLDVYVCATLSGSDSKKTQHWDMVALGLCIAGILLCLVDYALVCRTPKWRFAAVGSASSADQPICIVVVNHQDSV